MIRRNLITVFTLLTLAMLSRFADAADAPTTAPAASQQSVEKLLANRPSVLFIGVQNYVEPDLAREMMDRGYIVDASNWAGVNIDRLRRYNTVVISSWANPGETWQAKYEDALDEYLQQGGGIINFFAQWEELALPLKPWFEKYGLQIVHETVTDPATAKDMPRPKYIYGNKLSLAKTVNPHPVTKDVHSLWYPTGFGGYGKPAAMPLVVDSNWTVLVATEKSSTINHAADALPQNFRADMEGKQGSWPIIAARRIGNGRIVSIGLNPMLYVWGPHFDKWDLVAYRNGIDGVPSDFQTLLYNSLTWTSEPSMKSGTMGYIAGTFPPKSQGDTAPVDWSNKDFTAAGPWLYGLMGAHTNLSTGKGTVAEWAEAAKAEGLSFIVFLEDMKKMNAEKWAQLRADCISSSNESFRCYPGMEYVMKVSTGGRNHCFVIDGRKMLPWPQPRYITPDGELDVNDEDMKATWHMAFGTIGTAGYIAHDQNDIPWWDYKNYGLTSILARKDGKTIDDAIPQYLETAAAQVNVMPMAVSLENDPAKLKGIRADGRPLIVVNGAPDKRYPQMGSGVKMIDLHVGSGGEQWNEGIAMYRGWYGPTITEGPAASLRFRGGYQWKRVEYPRYRIERYNSVEQQDWYLTSYMRLPVRLDVSSDAPISEIVIYDGTKVYKRFDAKGEKTFTADFTVSHDQNRHLIAYVKDTKGRRALTPELWTEQQQYLYNYCADRCNAPMGSGSSPGHGAPLMEGLVPMDTAFKEAIMLYPLALPATGRESRRYQLDLSSADIYIERANSDRYFTKINKYPTAWHNFAGSVPRDDVSLGTLRYEFYQRHGRKFQHGAEMGFIWDGYPYGPGDDAPKHSHYAAQENWGETKKDLKVVAGCDFIPGLSQIVWESEISEAAPAKFVVHTPSGAGASGQVYAPKGNKIFGPLPDGSAIVIDTGYTIRVRGQGLGYAFFATEKQAQLRIAPMADGTAKSGTKTAWRYETITESLAKPLDPDISWLTVKQGTMIEHFVGATIDAKDHVAEIAITQQPLKTNSTPLEVRGVNSNWMCGYFEPSSGQFRPIGSSRGVAYAQIDARLKNVAAVIGNVITCNQPDVRISVTQQTNAEGLPTGVWQVEANNPTDKPLQTEFAVPAAFSMIKQRQHAATLPPAGTVKFELK